MFNKKYQIKSIRTYKKVINSVLYHLGIYLLEFETAEVRDLFVSQDSFDAFHMIFYDEFKVSNMVLVFGWPVSVNPEQAWDHFTDEGVTSIKILKNENDFDALAILIECNDEISADRFIQRWNKAVFLGRELTVTKLNMERGVSWKLNAMGICDVEDFTLKYYDVEYKCWSGAAIAKSEVIARYIQANPERTSFIVPRIVGPFESIVEYLKGHEIQMTDTNSVFIYIMSRELAIKELEAVAHRFVYETGNLTSCITILENLFRYELERKDHLNFVASKITTTTQLPRYPLELIEEVLSSPYLALTSEQDIAAFIENVANGDTVKHQTLLKHVTFT